MIFSAVYGVEKRGPKIALDAPFVLDRVDTALVGVLAVTAIYFLVYPARFSPTTDWRRVTEHWLAVEVLSRSSRIYDREFKRDAYFALGLQQVWLVDWHDRSVEVCTAKGTSSIVRDAIRWRVADVDVAIDLRQVFSGLP